MPAPDLAHSLESILKFGSRVLPGLQSFTNILLEPPDRSTNWGALINSFLDVEKERGRALLNGLLFLVTRILLPNQIAHNRELLTTLYHEKRLTNVRLSLRYDMLRAWKKPIDVPGNATSTPSELPPADTPDFLPFVANIERPLRQGLIPDIIARLTTAPKDGYKTKTAEDKMKHHVTALDDMLLLRDEEVEGWPDLQFSVKLAGVIILWQQMRENNELLDDMRVHDWEALEGDEGAMWFVDV
ncbi:hypothetical protein K491DRAFT_120435 [Lophiostoma macrostomum CBS 122681]|uniref:Uncharacterized protein n=1 Tax=Lophiostoma macrostomum CBS 122681 TaxID=1314788 RepID=A0A6A6TLS7_9PLEO|nr:hypothetical protein K491DRAFT_120435 [Lophiostoma macrostomum CBS 122681]